MADWPLISPYGSATPPELQSHSCWSRAPCLPSPPPAGCNGPVDSQTQQFKHVSIMSQPSKPLYFATMLWLVKGNHELFDVENSIIKLWFDNNTHWLLLMVATCRCFKMCGVQKFTIPSCLATHLVCVSLRQVKGWEMRKTSLESSPRLHPIRRRFRFHPCV